MIAFAVRLSLLMQRADSGQRCEVFRVQEQSRKRMEQGIDKTKRKEIYGREEGSCFTYSAREIGDFTSKLLSQTISFNKLTECRYTDFSNYQRNQNLFISSC
ncbi:uncharacterized protein LOC110839230 [Zootermopsis nevadensis]|uniref:uncharacterized protein LOC110839230 n=1 Tax=Zootermopsis nevadensis TaxID=136037 RepID=UPI000B8E5179|nr:uncharacterized protein LOC110839230 [Zootermopsis nevadensis]